MIVREHIPLAELTTFKVGGIARVVVSCENRDEVETAVALMRDRGLPFVVLGEGSNVLPLDEAYEGGVLLMRTKGMAFIGEDDQVLASAEAGESWDAFVREAGARGLWGIENLAGIPGTVGAAPVQNIGAYGMEIQHMLTQVEVYDVQTGAITCITNEAAGFSYRDSRFKHEPNLIILRVTFMLSRTAAPHLGYADLRTALEEGKDMSTPQAIGDTVRAIRAKKFPDLSEYGTAGSFFKNPILSPEQFKALSEKYGAIPSYPNDKGIKIPLAFILDRVLGLRGYRLGPAFLFGNQPLVLVAEKGASAHEIETLARDIELRVEKETGIHIEREVKNISAHETKTFL